jgi:tRNA dimethylallyltransferase
LRTAIAARLAAMLERGALEEVRLLLALKLDPDLPLMRAQGVPQLAAYFRGEVSFAEAQRLTELATGRYAKRQTTWFRHHALAPEQRGITINARYEGLAQFSETARRIIEIFLRP